MISWCLALIRCPAAGWLLFAGADLNRWQHFGLNYKLSFRGAVFPLFISAVSLSEAPLQAIYGALFLGKLIMGARPGRSFDTQARTDSFGLELLWHTQSIMKWEGVIPRAVPPVHLMASHTGQYQALFWS